MWWEEKDFSPSEEERKFLSVYGSLNLESWYQLSEYNKSEYKRLELLYGEFFNLWRDYYEDLRLYAYMYRNVPLHCIEYDVVSISFFVAHKKEIIGYKKRLSSVNSKDSVVLLYGENPVLFPKLCLKYAGVDFQSGKTIYTRNTFKESILTWQNKEIYHVFSIDDLTDIQCEIILKYGNDIHKEYANLVDKYLGVSQYYTDTFLESSRCGFASKWFMRLLLNPNRGKWNEQVLQWLSDHMEGIDIKSYLQGLKEKYDSLMAENLSQKKALREKKEALEKEMVLIDRFTSLKKTSYINPTYPYVFGISHLKSEIKRMTEAYAGYGIYHKQVTLDDIKRKQEELKIAEQKNIEFQKEQEKQEERERARREEYQNKKRVTEIEIANINNTISALVKESSNIRLSFERFISEDPNNIVFITLYEHQDEINRLINEPNEIEYNRMWLNYTEKMQKIERCSTHYMNFTTWGRVLRGEIRLPLSIFYKSISGDTAFQFNKSSLMCAWISAYRQEIEQKKKELEEQERKEAERRKAEEEKRRREEEARRERYRYNERNKHQRDAYIHFDAKNHIYTVGGMALQSVTNFVEGCFPKFEAEIHAKGVAARMGISVNEVIAMWEKKSKESRDLGTLMHQKIEKYYQGIFSVEDDSFRLFKQFANQIPLQPYRTEWAVYDSEYNIAGTIDFVDYQNGKFTIYDWKRSNKIISNSIPIKSSKYKTMGLSPLEHLDDCPYYHYALQLSLYKFILERNYNLKISDLRLGIFHPDYNKPYVLRMPYLEDEIKSLMDLRSDVIL